MRENRTDNLAEWIDKEKPQFMNTKIVMVDESTDTSLDEESFKLVPCSCRILDADSDSSFTQPISPLSYKPSATLRECDCFQQRGKSLLDAVCTGNFDLMEICMDNDVDLHSSDQDGNTPVHLVSERGDIDMLAFLLSLKNINLNTQNSQGLTALSIAIKNCQDQAANLLLDYGADPNIPDNDGRTSIFFSVQRGNVEMTRKLIDHHANVNEVDVFGNTPIYMALVEKPIITMVKVLLSSGANPLLKTTRMNPYLGGVGGASQYKGQVCYWAILHGKFRETVLACTTHDRLKMVQILVENGVAVNVVEPISGRNCLHMNAINGFIPLAEYLVNSGADLEQIDMSGRTPNVVATEHHNLAVADFFLKAMSLKRVFAKEYLKKISTSDRRLTLSEMFASSTLLLNK